MTTDSRNQLLEQINRYFNSTELHSLCFSLGLDYDDELPGTTRSEKIIALITWCERQDRLLDLVGLCREQRPTINWNLDFETGLSSSLPVTQMNAHRLEKYWIPIIVAIIGLAGVVFTAIYTNASKTPSVFDYQVRVIEESSGTPISGAKVTIEVGGQAPMNEFADSEGVARLFVDRLRAGKPGRIIVEMRDYSTYTENIDLVPEALPDIVQLERNP